MLNQLQYGISNVTAFVCNHENAVLKAPVQVYQTPLYKATVHAALAIGLKKEQYATWLLKAQRSHIDVGRKFHWNEESVRKAIHWRTTGKANLWLKIHEAM